MQEKPDEMREMRVNILVVDDDPDIRFATVRLLRNAGYPVSEAENGEMALRRVRKTRPHLVLLDVMLPDIDGYEICRTIKADQSLKNTYVILLSGKKTGADDQSEGLEIGADGYVVRPVSNRELLARVQSMVRIIRAESTLRKIEWMLSPKAAPGDGDQGEDHDQGYGDLTELNRDGIILKSIGFEHLKRFSDDYLELLGTSSAIYEVNGDYAFGIFSSGWCRLMDCASRRLCDTPDNVEALNSGRWLCHESCWTHCSREAIDQKVPVDIQCNGGIRIYAVPIFAGETVVGAMNFGYGDPPKDPETLRKLADIYHINYEDLVREADAYDSRPPFIIGLAKNRLHATAKLIGSMIETKQAEDALRESERRFRGMLGVVPDMISIHSPEMDILYSNWQGFAAVPEDNRTPNTKCYKTYRNFDDICPDCLAKTVLETQKPLREEIQLPDGIWIDLRVIPLLDKDDHVEMFMEWVRDITDRKQAEASLRESEETLRTTLNSIGDAVISTDMKGRVTSMNPVAESLTGWHMKEARGQPIETVFRIINEHTRQPVESPVTAVMKSGHIVGLANHTLLLARDGREIPIADSGAPIRNEAGDTSGVVMVFRDQTEERRSRQALESNYALLKIAGESAHFGGWTVDLDNNICTWSDAVADIHEVLHGYAPPVEKGIGFYAPEWREKITQVFSDCAKEGIPYDEDMEIITQKGNRVWVRTIGKAVKDETGRISKVQGSFQDITERKHAEEEREKLRHQLTQAQKMESIGRLAGGVAHDFNNMLSVILGYAELALDRISPDDPLHEDINEIQTAGRRAADVTRQLLAFARRQTIDPKVLDLNETVESMLRMLRRLIGEDIDLAWHPRPTLWPVKMDPSQIDQILVNLCLNARDAIGGVGKITIETDGKRFDEAYLADHAEALAGDFVMLAVTDNGRGMDAQTLENIYEPFFTTKGIGEGTGLGLPTVYGIVKQNNGFMNVYSEPGSGTTFRLYFPRHMASPEKSATAKTDTIPQGSGETVLVVEDDATILTMAEKMLDRLGYQVVTAAGPAQAEELAAVHGESIDLLMTDVIMPEMNGRDLSESLKARHPNLKVLFMSGYTANVIAHHGVLEDGVVFVQKPFSRKELATKVRQALSE